MIIATTPRSVAWCDPDDQSLWYFEFVMGQVDVYHLTSENEYEVPVVDGVESMYLYLVHGTPILSKHLGQIPLTWTQIQNNPMGWLNVEMLE